MRRTRRKVIFFFFKCTDITYQSITVKKCTTVLSQSLFSRANFLIQETSNLFGKKRQITCMCSCGHEHTHAQTCMHMHTRMNINNDSSHLIHTCWDINFSGFFFFFFFQTQKGKQSERLGFRMWTSRLSCHFVGHPHSCSPAPPPSPLLPPP